MRKFRWRRPLVVGMLLVGVGMSGCESKPAPQQNIPQVSYVTLSPTSVTLTTELSGRTSAYMVSDVRPQVSGIIQKRLFTEGADVIKDQVLYQIDTALYQAAYDNAKATLMRAEANAQAARLLAERYREVVKANAVSKQEYDNAVASNGQARAEVAAAQAALETARINLAYTKVIAPVSGRIGRSSITPGALVTQNQQSALATIQQLAPMYVDVTQSSTELLRLKRAYAEGLLKTGGPNSAKVKLKLEDGTLYTRRLPYGTSVPVEGDLLFSDVTVEQSTGVVTIRAAFDNPEGTLLPGMYVRAVVEEGINDTAILVPQKAVIRDNRGRPIAQKLVKNATIQDVAGVYNVAPAVLTVDRAIGNQWLVTSGLKAGDLLLVEGLQKARPGKPVQGMPEKPMETKPGDTAGQPAAGEASAAGAKQ